MADSINLNDLFSRFESTGIFERLQQRFDLSETSDSDRGDRANEVARNDNTRGQLRAALARRRRNTEAVQVEFSRRSRETGAARETEQTNAPRPAEAPEQDNQPRTEPEAARTSLRQRFQQAIAAFQTANQPAQARGRDGGQTQGAAPPGAAGDTRANQRRSALQIGNLLDANTRQDEPRLDGLRMAASFQQTALGNALNQNQPPIARLNNPVNQGPLTQRQGVNAAGGAAQNAGGALFGGGGANPIGRANRDAPAAIGQGFGGADQQTQGPLARVLERFNNPGAPGAENNPAPLAARTNNTRGGLNQEPLVERIIPGENNTGAATRAGGGNPAPNYLDQNNQNINQGGSPLTRGNAAPGEGAVNNPGAGNGANPLVENQVTPDLLTVDQGNLTGPGAGAQLLAGNDALAGREGAAGPGVAAPPNPQGLEQTDLLRNAANAPLEAQGPPDQAVGGTLEDLQRGTAPERGTANPAIPEPAPTQTPAEEAVALGTTQREAADAELRANVPRPILQPIEQDGAGRTPPGVVADAELRGGGAPPTGGPPTPAVAEPPGNTGTAQTTLTANQGTPPPAPATQTTAPEQAAGGGPGAAPPGNRGTGPAANAGAGAADNMEGAAPAVEGPGNRAERSALEDALESRATRAYEQQQEESQTTEPNRGRTVTELFVR